MPTPAAASASSLSAALKTTTWTTSVVSTVTETMSKVVSIWFRNERIPTTILSSQTRLVTDTIVMTSTLQPVEPTMRVRERRDAVLESSIASPLEGEAGQKHSDPLPMRTARWDEQALLTDLLTRPQVAEAWNHFLKVAGESIDEDQRV